MNKEIWKTVEDAPNYEVSNLGNVRHRQRKQNLKLANNKGYLRFNCIVNGEHKYFLVHRCVAKAFLDNPQNYPCVNHKDENKTNNCVDNLEWCSHQYNSNYGTAIQRSAEKRRGQLTPTTSMPVYCVELDKTFISIREAARELGIDNSCIAKCCKGKVKTYKGYHWEYIKEEK